MRNRWPHRAQRYSPADAGASSSAQAGQGMAKIDGTSLDIAILVPRRWGRPYVPSRHPIGVLCPSAACDGHTEGVVDPVRLRAEQVPPVGGSSQLILIDGRTFAIGDRQGDIGGGAEGYVHADRRHLSRFEVLVDGAHLSPLAVATPSPSSFVVVHRLRDEHGLERSAVVVRRRRIRTTLHEDVELWATGREPITVTLTVGVAADFAHLFDVKAGRRHPATEPTVILDGFEFRGRRRDDDGPVGRRARRARQGRRNGSLDPHRAGW